MLPPPERPGITTISCAYSDYLFPCTTFSAWGYSSIAIFFDSRAQSCRVRRGEAVNLIFQDKLPDFVAFSNIPAE
jgi:hypothetical protein